MERDDEKIRKKLDKVLDDIEYSVNKHKIDRQREEERKYKINNIITIMQGASQGEREGGKEEVVQEGTGA